MKERLAKRVWSERGASMSMALMLFLVVTVVASVVITAATAVSGRYSQLAEADRTYYNVTSAAELFWDKLKESDGSATVEVVRACDAMLEDDVFTPIDSSWTVSIDDAFGLGVAQDGSSLTPRLSADTGASLFQIVTADLIFSPAPVGSSDTPRSYAYVFDADNPASVGNTIDFSGGATEEDPAPKDPSFAEASYTPFSITSSNDAIKPVYVTLRREPSETFEFVFSEASCGTKNNSFRCTLTTMSGITDESMRDTDLGNGKHHLEWVTTVTWEADGLSAGGGKYEPQNP